VFFRWTGISRPSVPDFVARGGPGKIRLSSLWWTPHAAARAGATAGCGQRVESSPLPRGRAAVPYVHGGDWGRCSEVSENRVRWAGCMFLRGSREPRSADRWLYWAAGRFCFRTFHPQPLRLGRLARRPISFTRLRECIRHSSSNGE